MEREESRNMVSVALYCRSDRAIKVEFGFAIDGIASRSGKHEFQFDDNGAPTCFGFDLLTRDEALTSLQNGALVIEVRMKKTSEKLPPFIPENLFACKGIQDMYMDQVTADVAFEVGGQYSAGRAKTKKIKTATTKFYAHRHILMNAAPQLAELCMMSNESSPCIAIPNMLACTFEDMLRYIYGHPMPIHENDPTRMYTIIEAANKYGVTNLKLEAEVKYVSLIEKTLSIENFMEYLLNADAINLAYLKEVVMDFIVENKTTIMKKNVLANAPGGLFNDILAAVSRSEAKAGVVVVDEAELGNLSINDLRQRAHASGLCVDGSREALIAAIEADRSISL